MASVNMQDFDAILKAIAKGTKTNKDTDDLGTALHGISTDDIASAKLGNGGGQTYDGTLNMLRDWRKKQTSSTERRKMGSALKQADMNQLLDKFFPEYNDDLSQPNSGDRSSPPPPSVDPFQNCAVRRVDPNYKALDPDMKYVMWKSAVKGNALIIGNQEFQRSLPRPWSEMDVNNMQQTLESLRYDFQQGQNIHRNLTAEGMGTVVQRFTDQLRSMNPQPQSAVVYISSHGSEQGIQGSDGAFLSIPHLLEKFSGVLLGKPKVIFIDACWGSTDAQWSSDVRNSSSGVQPLVRLPKNADIFLIHATTYGNTSLSHIVEGSFFVQKLREVVYNQERELEDLDTIMLRVTRKIHELTSDRPYTQSTTVLKQGVDRKLFFFPGFSTNA